MNTNATQKYPVKLDIELYPDQYEKLKNLLNEFGINIASEGDKVVVTFHLTRTRFEENELWTDTLFLLLDRSEFEKHTVREWENPDFLVEILKDRIAKGLASKEGWDDIVQASMDYNWGDWVMSLPMPTVGIYCNSNDITGYPGVAYCDLMVRQDELLAPTDASGTLVLEKDGVEVMSCEVKIDLMENCIYNAEGGLDEEQMSQYDRGYIRFTNGDIVECNPEEDFLALKTE